MTESTEIEEHEGELEEEENEHPEGQSDREEAEDFDDDEADLDDDDLDDEPEDAELATDDEPNRKRGRPRSDAPLDEQSQRALDFVRDVLHHMEMDCKVQARRPREEDGRDISLEIQGRDSARVIGKRGQVLGALQFLTNRILNRPGEERRYVTVDAEGYRSRRDNSLTAMAKRLGKQAVTDGKIITFEPMPPRDRRLVHLALAKFDGVITKSEGEGETRRVQIIPVRRST